MVCYGENSFGGLGGELLRGFVMFLISKFVTNSYLDAEVLVTFKTSALHILAQRRLKEPLHAISAKDEVSSSITIKYL